MKQSRKTIRIFPKLFSSVSYLNFLGNEVSGRKTYLIIEGQGERWRHLGTVGL
jgi:hypothetical protein